MENQHEVESTRVVNASQLVEQWSDQERYDFLHFMCGYSPGGVEAFHRLHHAIDPAELQRRGEIAMTGLDAAEQSQESGPQSGVAPTP